jgi:L-ascorbate metabolism protein UlaG (beta-lactamase superfamily)
VLNTSSGLKVLMDPAGTGTGYKIPTIDGVNLVTVSHEHSDHNAINLASGNPLVLRGLAGGDWAKIDQMIKDVRVYSVATFHDGKQGAERGKNAVFLFDLKGLRLAHCGDLGHVLSAEQAKALGAVDILIIPVGGYYTIDAKAAAETIKLVNPKAVVPMHYKTADLSANLAGVLAPVDDFVKAISGETAVIDSGQTVAFVQGKLPEKRTVYILKYK